MKTITINNKEYKFEFSLEATFYNEVTEELMNGFITGGKVQGAVEEKSMDKVIQYMVSTFSNVPQRTLTLFYAGLLEHHGARGDKSVLSKDDAMELIKAYISEHREDNDGKGKSLYDIMNEMLEIIAQDHFFEMIGMEQMVESLTEPKKKTRKSTKSKDGEN